VAIASEDLIEILGPLLENAVRFARRQVGVAGSADSGGIILSVEDDGPGIQASDISQALKRGARLDEAGGGHGLGLAIARQLVEACGGTIALGASPLGGLRVDLRWTKG
jgi:signal transduction histidine kinase